MEEAKELLDWQCFWVLEEEKAILLERKHLQVNSGVSLCKIN
jgi:hypothetical protein